MDPAPKSSPDHPLERGRQRARERERETGIRQSLEPGSGVPKEGSGGWEVPHSREREREKKVRFT